MWAPFHGNIGWHFTKIEQLQGLQCSHPVIGMCISTKSQLLSDSIILWGRQRKNICMAHWRDLKQIVRNIMRTSQEEESQILRALHDSRWFGNGPWQDPGDLQHAKACMCHRITVNKVWWLCLVPTSTTRFASDVGYRMAKIKHSCTRKIFFMNKWHLIP